MSSQTVADDLERRTWEHQNDAVKGFTKRTSFHFLVHYETFHDIREAIAREKEIKGWRRSKRNALVETLNPKWVDLSATLFGRLGGPSHSLGMTMRGDSSHS
ncbi:MAG: GIY-YIG nuclease family protein [Chthoniobacterales bacterium]|nr:GIY-YIG nuclease family protein [Chthoniobacterales bacterium]